MQDAGGVHHANEMGKYQPCYQASRNFEHYSRLFPLRPHVGSTQDSFGNVRHTGTASLTAGSPYVHISGL